MSGQAYRQAQVLLTHLEARLTNIARHRKHLPLWPGDGTTPRPYRHIITEHSHLPATIERLHAALLQVDIDAAAKQEELRSSHHHTYTARRQPKSKQTNKLKD